MIDDSAWVWRMSGLTRNGTAEPVPRDQILRREGRQRKVRFPCSADHEEDWQPYPVDPYSAESADHKYIHTYNEISVLLIPSEVNLGVFATTHARRGSNGAGGRLRARSVAISCGQSKACRQRWRLRRRQASHAYVWGQLCFDLIRL